MRSLLSWPSKLAPYFLGAFILWTWVPRIKHNFEHEGMRLPTRQRLNLKTSALTQFPRPNRSLVIFWATWCAPCKLEMARLKQSVESGKIKPEQIFAVNPFEDNSTVIKYIKNTPYPFTFIADVEISNKLGIQVTPTLAWLDGEKVERLSSGLSIIGIWRAEHFLQ